MFWLACLGLFEIGNASFHWWKTSFTSPFYHPSVPVFWCISHTWTIPVFWYRRAPKITRFQGFFSIHKRNWKVKKACSIRLIRWDDQLNKPALDEFASLCIQVGISRKNLQLAHFNMPFLTPNQRNHPSFWGDRGSDQGCHGEGILWGDQGVGICWGMILGWILGNEMGLIPFFWGKRPRSIGWFWHIGGHFKWPLHMP